MKIQRRRLEPGPRQPVRGPLVVHADNPRYFADAEGHAVYLTGSHTWANIHERRYPERPPFDYDAYLDWLVGLNHNCTRLWAWEHATWMQFSERPVAYEPNRYLRTGPGLARDGLPRFDLTQFDDSYFSRLRERVELAGKAGIYVLVMLFQGFSIEQKLAAEIDHHVGNPWEGHPFHRDNNVNGIDGDPQCTDRGRLVHTLALPRVLAFQERFVRRVVRLLNDQDHVIWEISNESPGASVHWQYHMISLIKALEQSMTAQHPVAMTFPWDAVDPGTNAALFVSPADAISPGAEGGYKDAPPPADGSKVIISDTDHLWGIGGSADWVWRTFLAGQNPIFMDPYHDIRGGEPYDGQWDAVRRAMGYTLCYAQRLDLAQMTPADELVDAGHCLAHPGHAYLLYVPDGQDRVSLDLSQAQGSMSVEWFHPETEDLFDAREVSGGQVVRLKRPDAGYCVALVQARNDQS